MKKSVMAIENIPAILWGDKADRLYIYVHGKLGDKEEARFFAEKAVPRGFQVLSLDLPEHGGRKEEGCPCAVWNGVSDLAAVGEYARRGWSGVYLYAVSLGAYFSLLAYRGFPLVKCLFLSPLLDMQRLIESMLRQLGVSPQTLEERGEIPAPGGETLRWDYYSYVRERPVDEWNVPTEILYGSEDALTPRDAAAGFAKRFFCGLTVLEGGGHWFHGEGQLAFLDGWLDKHI